MKHGICLTPVYPRAIYDNEIMVRLLEKVRSQGLFDCVEIYSESSGEGDNIIRRMLEDTGLEAVYLGGLPIKRDRIDLSAENELNRIQGVALCKLHIDHAVGMGCSKIVVAAGPVWKKDCARERIAGQMRRSLEELDDYCRGSRLEISVEPFPVKTEPYLAVGDTDMVLSIFQDSNFKNVGITFDTSHFAQLGENIEESFQILKPWIRHIHLANCVIKDNKSPLYGDKHPTFSQEGGSFTVESIRKFYKETQQTGGLKNVDICSLEVISQGKEEQYYQEISREAREIWK